MEEQKTATNQQPDTRQKCAYCYKPIDPEDLEMGQIISRNWKHQGLKSPPRPYHRSKRCKGYDQMAHEG